MNHVVYGIPLDDELKIACFDEETVIDHMLEIKESIQNYVRERRDNLLRENRYDRETLENEEYKSIIDNLCEIESLIDNQLYKTETSQSMLYRILCFYESNISKAKT